MPMIRYEIRSECSLADPQLYTAADKDDPEALLEGVAMYGLVGLLRQLGDLSEFAAVIFHELHEEVIVTATKGHNLLSRVQQLEAEFSSIEKAFHSQTDYSSFVSSAGVDWHPNLQIDHNHVTRGNLPRFIMDSYEECRGPPRLFLLDKFDTAGAGACLKRYSDPSFFKIEIYSIEMNDTDIHREKKIRKAKRRGSHWRNGGNPEVLPSSHAKLHQLFMEDHLVNGIGNPEPRVKLKRRLTGFPYDLKTGKSYMEKVLRIPSPEHEVLYEVGMNSAPLKTLITAACVDRDTMENNRSPPSTPRKEDILLKPSVSEPDEVFPNKILKEDHSYPSILEDNIPYTGDGITSELVMAVDEEIKADNSLIGYLTDDYASEIDNYVDVPMAIESELDTDSEFREKADVTSCISREPTRYDVTPIKEQLQFHSSHPQSIENSMLSDDGNHSSSKEMSSFSSSVPNMPAGSEKSEHYVSAEAFHSADSPEIESIELPFLHKTADEECPVAHHTRSAVSDDAYAGTYAITNQPPDYEQQNFDQNRLDLEPTKQNFDSEYILKGFLMREPESGEASYILDEDINTTLVKYPPCSPSFSDFNLQLEDKSLSSTSGVHPLDKSNYENRTCKIPCLAVDSSVATSVDILQVDDFDPEDLLGPEHEEKSTLANREAKKENLATYPTCSFSVAESRPELRGDSPSSSAVSNKVQQSDNENEPCISTISHISSDDIPAVVSSDVGHKDKSSLEILHLGNNKAFQLNRWNILPPNEDNTSQILKDGELKLPENFRLDYPYSVNDEHSFMSALPVEEKSVDASDNVARDLFSYSSNGFSFSMEASLLEELEKTSAGNAETVDAEEHASDRLVCNQICSSYVKCSQDTNDSENVVILDKETTVNNTLSVESLNSCEVLKLVIGTINDVSSNDLAALQSLISEEEKFERSTGATNTVEKRGITSDMSSIGQEAKDISVSREHTPLNDNTISLGNHDFGTDESKNIVVASSVLSIANIFAQDDLCSPLGIEQLVEDDKPCVEDSDPGTLENKKNLIEGSERGIAPSDLDKLLGNTISYNHRFADVPATILHQESDLVDGYSMDFVNSTKVMSFPRQIDLDPEHKSCQKRTILDQAVHFHLETTPQELANVLPNQLSQELVDSGEIDTNLFQLSSTHDQLMLDHDDNQTANDCTSKSSIVDRSGHPSVPELPTPSKYEIDVSEPSMFPPGSCLLEAKSINLEAFPPLPPLPPVQWRMGKVQHAFSTIRSDTSHEEFFLQGTLIPLVCIGDVDSLGGDLDRSLVQFSHDTISNKEKLGYTATVRDTVDLPVDTENEKQILTISSSEIECALAYKGDDAQISANVESSKEKVERSSTNLEATVLKHEIANDKLENEKQELVPSTVTEFTPQDVEEGITNGSQTKKLPQPLNPLIDTVTALDKSRLRKVTERVRAEVQKVEERDTLLEQIRTKSFSLKPALLAKPSFQGPKTNLKVAAILEKANAIRQALAGSDEDDEDSWSDS